MKLEITVDSLSPLLCTRDVKAKLDDKEVNWISYISFIADVNNATCDLTLKQGHGKDKFSIVKFLKHKISNMFHRKYI